MDILTVLFLFGAYTVSAWLFLQKHLLYLLMGSAVLAHALHFSILAIGLGDAHTPALIPNGSESLPTVHSDPLPQALVLTAIVIGLGVTAYAASLSARSFKEKGDDDIDGMKKSDSIGPAKAQPKVEAGEAV